MCTEGKIFGISEAERVREAEKMVLVKRGNFCKSSWCEVVGFGWLFEHLEVDS